MDFCIVGIHRWVYYTAVILVDGYWRTFSIHNQRYCYRERPNAVPLYGQRQPWQRR